jgi:hypothetical protein
MSNQCPMTSCVDAMSSTLQSAGPSLAMSRAEDVHPTSRSEKFCPVNGLGSGPMSALSNPDMDAPRPLPLAYIVINFAPYGANVSTDWLQSYKLVTYSD